MPTTDSPPPGPGPAPLRLRAPTAEDEAALRTAHAELVGEGFGFLFEPHRPWREQLAGFERQARGTDLPADRVPADFLVAELALPTGPVIVGRVSIRHRLTPLLLEIGGHVGYAVRPAFRRRGHGTAMLARSVQHLATLGVHEVLVTCDDDNIASARVIEGCGGVLEDVRHVADGVPDKLRYWIASR